MAGGIQILFSPADVKKVLVTLPSVAALIPDPSEEGADSEAFPGVLRKTKRELYRWIANTHYQHLAEVVPTLERVHAAGCTFGHLLKTRSRQQFVSHTAEVFVADDLVRRGYAVTTVQRSSEVAPDLHVTGNDLDLAVEVYNPRELQAVDDWVREANDLLNYVDIRASYRSCVSTREEITIPPGPTPLSPWAVADALEESAAERAQAAQLRTSAWTSAGWIALQVVVVVVFLMAWTVGGGGSGGSLPAP